MLPDMEGFEVARRLGAERAGVPIIFLTARDATEDKVRGLTIGGDDYVTKPFSLEELVARIRDDPAPHRRSPSPSRAGSSFEDLELDEDTREVTRAGEPIELTATEYRLLRYLMLNPRRVLTRAQLLDHVWDYDFGGDARVLETYISYLRKKLDVHGPPLIHTVRGVGYALRAPRASVMPRCAARLVAGAARARRGRAAAARRRSPTPSSARSCSTASTSRRRPRPRGRRRRSPSGSRLRRRATARARRRDGAGRRRRGPAAGPAARHLRRSCATRAARHRRRRLSSTCDDDRHRRPTLPGEPRRSAGRRPSTAGRHGHALPRARDARPGDGGTTRRRGPADARPTQTLHRLLLVEALVIAGVLLALGARRAGWSCASGCCPLDRMGAHRGRDRRRRPLAPRRARPTRAPRSAASASR